MSSRPDGTVEDRHRDLLAGFRAAEDTVRAAQARRTELLTEIIRTGAFLADNHLTPAAFVEAATGCTRATAAEQVRVARLAERLPLVAKAGAAGQVGWDTLALVATRLRNPRVQTHLPDLDPQLAVQVTEKPAAEIAASLARWIERADPDGTADREEHHHRNRNITVIQQFDGGYRIHGRCGALQGTILAEQIQLRADALRDADWRDGKAVHGDTMSVAKLPRTPAQYRADALVSLIEDALAALPGGPRPEPLVSIVIGKDDFDSMVAAGEADAWPTDPDAVPAAGTTPGGHRIPAQDTLAAAITGWIQMVVVAGDGHVINYGYKQRLFRGAARAAATFGRTECLWIGCHTPVQHCQVDHRRPAARGGRTDQDNADLYCGPHNRNKEHGFTVSRHLDGTVDYLRPDGTPITIQR
jgi:hypothetical protein